MATIVVLAQPPEAGEPLAGLAGSVLSSAERARLYRASLVDVVRAVQAAGPQVLVNYPPAERAEDTDDPERAIRDALRDLVPEPGEIRYEVQVGETDDGRVGNALTHLLREEGADSAGVIDPGTAFLTRADVGQATMKLRSTEVVLGPAPRGRVYFAGFTEPIDFADAFATPALETLTERGRAADYDVDFLPVQPLHERPADLVDVVAGVRARRRAERQSPAATAAVVEELGLRVDEQGIVTGADNA